MKPTFSILFLSLAMLGCAQKRKSDITIVAPTHGMTLSESLLAVQPDAVGFANDEIVLVKGSTTFFIRNGRLSHWDDRVIEFVVDGIVGQNLQKKYRDINVAGEVDELYLNTFRDMTTSALELRGWQKDPTASSEVSVKFVVEKEQKFSSYNSLRPIFDWVNSNTQVVSYVNGRAIVTGLQTKSQVSSQVTSTSIVNSRTASNSILTVTMHSVGRNKRSSIWQTNARLDDSATDPRATFARLISVSIPVFGNELKNQYNFWQSTNDPRVSYVRGVKDAIAHTYPIVGLGELKGKYMDFTKPEYQRLNTSDPNIVSIFPRNGDTLLHLACKHGITPIVEALLKYDIDLSSQGTSFTPLQLAVQQRNRDIVTLLIKKGAPLEGYVATDNAEIRSLLGAQISVRTAIKKWNLYEGELPLEN